jgi:hypothetical protein
MNHILNEKPLPLGMGHVTALPVGVRKLPDSLVLDWHTCRGKGPIRYRGGCQMNVTFILKTEFRLAGR